MVSIMFAGVLSISEMWSVNTPDQQEEVNVSGGEILKYLCLFFGIEGIWKLWLQLRLRISLCAVRVC